MKNHQTETIKRPVILFISDSEITTRLFSPVAKSISKLATDFEIRLIDVSKFVAAQNRNEFIRHKNDLFTNNGFSVDIIDPDDEEKDDTVSAYLRRLSKAFNDLSPQLIVIPHEFGWSFYAARLAASLDIKTYHLQHGFWGPFEFGERTVATAERHENVPPRIDHQKKIDILMKDFFVEERKILIEYMHRSIGPVRKFKQELSLKLSKHDRIDLQSAGTAALGANTTRKGVWGPYYKRIMIASGIVPDSIDIVGSTLTDDFFLSPIKTYEKICEEYGMNPSRKDLLLYFWDPLERYPNRLTKYDPKEVFIEIVQILRQHQPQTNVLLLIHPRDEVKDYKQWIGNAGLDHVYVGQTNMNHNSLFTHAELVIGTMTSALAEAAIFKKPILQLALLVYDNLVPQLIEMGAVVPILNRLHIRDQIEKILFNKPFVDRVIMNQKHFIEEIFYRCDGKAGERVAMSILKTIGV